jgi:hypothetical protein
VVGARRFANAALTVKVFRALSMVTVALPVPGELFGGFSPGPVNVATKVMGVANAADAVKTSTTVNNIRATFILNSN